MTALPGVLFLAAVSSRSKAYAQALSHSGLEPARTLVFGDTKGCHRQELASDPGAVAPADLFLPNLSVPLLETCGQAGWNVDVLDNCNVNDQSVASYVADLNPDYVIYSGYGGQIVGQELLGLDVKFIHCHSGWLPEYCGSTTLYYSMLRENSCSVTAFFLDEKIDNGPVIARRHYPPPPPGLDVDHVYDGAIRADLLVRVLADLATSGRISAAPVSGRRQVYYVIHPVLKNVAIMRRGGTG